MTDPDFTQAELAAVHLSFALALIDQPCVRDGATWRVPDDEERDRIAAAVMTVVEEEADGGEAEG